MNGEWDDPEARPENEAGSSGSSKPSGLSETPEKALRVVSGWPVLDSAALYGLAGEIMAAIEPHTEADPAGLLISLLVEFGAIVGSGPHALADSAEHPARLFAIAVGETSKGRKGSAEKNVGRVTSQVDQTFYRERRLNGFGSGEALVDTLRGSEEAARDNRLLVVEPEFARILSVARRDGSTLSTIIRQAWDGGRLAVRSRSGTTVAEDSHVCVIGHISADELRSKLTETEVAGGFANRFLFVCVRRSKVLPTGGNLDDRDLAELIRLFVLFVDRARTVGRMRRSAKAEELWSDLYYQMADDEPGGLLGAIIARDAAQVLRLSVTYALLDGSKVIDIQHVTAAWAMWRYCRDSAAYIFGESIGNPIADQLLKALNGAGNAGLDGREQHALFAGNASKRQLEAARELLVSKNLAVIETVRTGSTGRPAEILKATYELNELIHLKGQIEISTSLKAPGVHYELNELNELIPTDDSPPRTDDEIYSMMSESEGQE